MTNYFPFVTGLPPIEVKSLKKKVNDRIDSVYTNSVSYTNSTNTDNTTDEDDNGNRASVADLCKKFDEKPVKTTKNGTSNTLSYLSSKTPKLKPSKVIENDETSSRATTKLTNGKKINSSVVKKSSNGIYSTTVNGKKSDSLTSSKCQSNVDVLQSKLEVNNEGEILENGTDVNREDVGSNSSNEDTIQKSNSRVNNFASYISTKDLESVDDKVNGSNSTETSKNDMDNKDNSYLGKILVQNVSNIV